MKAKKTKPLAPLTYGDFTHHLKSPLASVFSLVMLLKRQSSKPNAQFEELEKKLQLLNKRIDQVTRYIRVQQEEPLLYAFFPLAQLVGETIASLPSSLASRVKVAKLPHTELLGDLDLLQFALAGVLKNYLAHEGATVQIRARVNTKNVEITLHVKKGKAKQFSSESNTEAVLLSSIAERVMELHGGSMHSKDEKIALLLPLRPKKSSDE